ncbi:unnamed protein product [Camellia sinensis]
MNGPDEKDNTLALISATKTPLVNDDCTAVTSTRSSRSTTITSNNNPSLCGHCNSTNASLSIIDTCTCIVTPSIGCGGGGGGGGGGSSAGGGESTAFSLAPEVPSTILSFLLSDPTRVRSVKAVTPLPLLCSFKLKLLVLCGLEILNFFPQLLHVLDGVPQNRSLIHFGDEGDQRSENDEALVELLSAAALSEDVVGGELVLRRSFAESGGGVGGVARFGGILVAAFGVEEGDAEEDVFEEPLGGAVYGGNVVVVLVVGGTEHPLGEC